MRARMIVVVRRDDVGGSQDAARIFIEELQRAIDSGLITGDVGVAYDQAPVYSHEWYVDNGMRAEGF